MECPTEAEIVRSLDGACSPEDVDRVRLHVTTCDTCRDVLEDARADLDLLPDLKAAWRSQAPGSAEGATTAAREGPLALARYRIVRRVAEGGMGIVFEAEQIHPRRRVALKVLRPGLMSERALWRFEHEVDVLGRLDHEGIARVYDAGTFDSGQGRQPFFAMEWLEARQLTHYAEAAGLGLNRRLEILAEICDAVEHAHQKGVIHRDLKPANILVTEDGRPKIVDFGVALSRDGVGNAHLTEAGQVLGTLPYMSPEQVSGGAEAIDTRTDVYALGVVLHELLTGALPLDVSGRSLPEVARIITECEPVRLGRVDRRLRGDLEIVVQRALAKAPSRRYPTAESLGRDLRRVLNKEPISARPASRLYVARRFVARHRLVVVAASFCLLLLTLTSLVATVLALREQEAKELAQTSSRDAKRRLAQSEEIRRLFEDVVIQASPWFPKSRNPTVKEALLRAAERVDEGIEDPEVEAELRHVIGRALTALSDFEGAAKHLTRALELARSLYPRPHAKKLSVVASAAELARFRGEFGDAEALNREALAIAQELPQTPVNQRVRLLHDLGLVLVATGRAEEARTVADRALEIVPEDDATGARGQILKLSASVATSLGDPETGTRLLEQALTIEQRVHGRDAISVGGMLVQLSSHLREGQEGERALEAAKEALAIFREHFRDDNVLTSRALGEVGSALLALGRPNEAAKSLEEALELQRRLNGPESPFTAVAELAYARALAELGRWVQAEALLRHAVAIRRSALGAAHLDTLSALQHLAELLHRTGRTAEALEIGHQAARDARAAFPAESRWVIKLESSCAGYLAALQRFDEAIELSRRCFETAEKTLGELDRLTLLLLRRLIAVYELSTRGDDAQRCREMLTERRLAVREREDTDLR